VERFAGRFRVRSGRPWTAPRGPRRDRGQPAIACHHGRHARIFGAGMRPRPPPRAILNVSNIDQTPGDLAPIIPKKEDAARRLVSRRMCQNRTQPRDLAREEKVRIIGLAFPKLCAAVPPRLVRADAFRKPARLTPGFFWLLRDAPGPAAPADGSAYGTAP
jgi:hypothetical protein